MLLSDDALAKVVNYLELHEKATDYLIEAAFLPCPFCGTTDIKTDIYAYRDMCIISCNTCGCNGPIRDNSDDARVAWNSRIKVRNDLQLSPMVAPGSNP